MHRIEAVASMLAALRSRAPLIPPVKYVFRVVALSSFVIAIFGILLSLVMGFVYRAFPIIAASVTLILFTLSLFTYGVSELIQRNYYDRDGSRRS